MKSEAVFSPGDGYGGKGIHIFPSLSDATLLFLHGRGDSGEGWSVLLELVNSRPSLRGRLRLILPTADEMYITKYGIKCNAWFDSRSDRRDVDEDLQGFQKSSERIENIVRGEMQKGIKPERILLAGFSQGGAMSYFMPMHSQLQLGGVCCLSGWCPALQQLEQQQQQQQQISSALFDGSFPFVHMHGTADSVVDYSFARSSFQRAVAAAEKAAAEKTQNNNSSSSSSSSSSSKRFMFKTYEGLAHESSATEMDDFLDFIEDCLKVKQQQ
ncbi:hypothetical protein, conserved [Eimeria acervulina]|uniref:Phospholipase/carboxylesterase/thioesterase domain-containing protein n=1 Tax=Eimeria acervulina TaxID=5801 RepID=U6GR43_EIMAC|nr:hypothetical protein, conserved [Eimeria acervulina]CDI82660.1 hypothetical protein, conserved [Eimeria acervulina]